ncbi:HD domain-containing phosphohydrolase [Deinococcus aquiradiocola]|uniref:Diguanylate cyclase n=1 Tax=Deinococcus aquiradiocola TaxID=393059 RepID=A0A917PSH8_9DEIO|nr:HD domain-containing phosphohydrolase [Deinococcus aquiradiocola]GGJ89883.1 diguanylate cyclase [Deinococcus aquiradiocola]
MSAKDYHFGRLIQESDEQLRTLHAEVLRLMETSARDVVPAAQAYCRLADLLNDHAALAQSHVLLGQALLHASEFQPALEAVTSAGQTYAALHHQMGQAEAETLAGKISLSLGQFEEAQQHLSRAISRVEHGRDAKEQALHATALNHLAVVQVNRGNAGEALLSLEQALQLWITLHNPGGQINCLINLGNIQNELGQYYAAIRSLSRAYDLHKSDMQDVRTGALILSSLARVHSFNQALPLAVEIARAALVSAEETQDRALITSTRLNLGTFCLEADLHDEAELHLNAALQQSRDIGFQTAEQATLDSLGTLYRKTERLTAAQEVYRAALALALELGDPQGQLEVELHLGAVELSLGHLSAATQHTSRSLVLAQEIRSPKEEIEAHRQLAVLASMQGDYRAAFEHEQAHTRVKDVLFNVERDRQTQNLSIQFEVERARHDADVYRIRTEVEQEARITAERLVQERTAELARAQHEVVTRLAMAAEYRDDTTGEHTRRVGRSSAAIARALGWPEDQAKLLGIAARLHDVGKIGIPDAILLKAGQLESVEYEQMKTHTLIGARILSGGHSELLRMAEEIALTHHERWDGSGYPLGLRESQIPMTGRIVALADVFDALTQARPYKRAWTFQEALEELQNQSGTHFDPLIVKTALRVLASPLSPTGGAAVPTALEEGVLDEWDASHILGVFEQLLVERTRDLEIARQQAEQATKNMARMAFTDSLTALPNRRAFEDDMRVVFQQDLAEADGGALAVIIFDLDGFKAANDTLGHSQGDHLLKAFGHGLEAAFRSVGRAYRIGGDEFAVIGTRTPDDTTVGRLLQTALEQARHQTPVQLSASMGIARYPLDARTSDDLLRFSDRQMYQDKYHRRSSR